MSHGDGFEPANLVLFNTGNNQRIDFREITAQAFEDFWSVAGFRVGREAARRRVPLGRGTVIFMGAPDSLRGSPGFAHFAVANAGPPVPLCHAACLPRNQISPDLFRPEA
jgi:hypothetical protein